MRRASWVLLWLLTFTSSAEAHRSKSYLLVNAGAGGLTGDVSGNVVDSRASPRLDLGVGFQVHDTALVEFSYGWSGTWTADGPYEPLPPEDTLLPDTEKTFQVGTNTMFGRLRYARSGVRTEYMKPEFSAGVGFVQVTRFLRNPAPIPPGEASQMLFAFELGASALVVFSRNFMAAVGLRYTITERRGIVHDLDNMDSIAFIVSFRGFLPSPRDLAEP